MHSKLGKRGDKFSREKSKEFWNRMADSSKWYLLGNSPVQWFNRDRVPQWQLDVLNGKPIKGRMIMKDWKIVQCQTV
jgi:hypothetical protein